MSDKGAAAPRRWRVSIGDMDPHDAWLTAIDRYLAHERAAGAPRSTCRTRQQHLVHMAKRIGIGPLDLDADELIDWFAEQHWAQETRRGRRTTLRSFFGWLVRQRLRDDDPSLALPRVKAVEGVARPCPDHVYRTALLRAAPKVELWLRLAAEMGMRREEIALIHKRDLLDDLMGVSLLVHGKGRRQRILPMPPSLAADLIIWIDDMGGAYAFPGDRDGHVSPEYVGKRATDVLDGEWTLHTLRHRFAARTMTAGGRDVYAVQELLGHASPTTTRRYVPNADPERLRSLVMAASAPAAPASRAAVPAR